MCSVSAIFAYTMRRRNNPFRTSDGRFLTKVMFSSRVRKALSTLGYEATTYAGHSFRIGAATTAAEGGIEDSIIKMLGRWDSSAYQLYVRASRQLLAGILRKLPSDDTHTCTQGKAWTARGLQPTSESARGIQRSSEHRIYY